MPKWIHDRAEHIMAKNPDMDKSQAFAIATQQSHALGKSPKGYGTSDGKKKAKKKYNTPDDDMKTADPKTKEAYLSLNIISGFRDELCKIANLGTPTVPGQMPKVNLPTVGKGPQKNMRYSQANTNPTPAPAASVQPVSVAPPSV